MCRSTTTPWNIIAIWLTFIVSFDMLIILFIFVPYQCGRVIIESGGEYVCEIWTSWYIFSAIFTILTIYSGFRLYRGWNSLVVMVARFLKIPSGQKPG